MEKKNNILSGFLCLLILIISSQNEWAQPLSAKFHHLTVEDGLPDGTIRALAQDKYGFMWIGTHAGVCRYDGHQIIQHKRKYGTVNSIADDLVNKLLITGDSVWIGTTNGLSLYLINKDTFITYSLPKQYLKLPSSNDVRSLVRDSKGVVWAATLRTISKATVKNGTCILMPSAETDSLPEIEEIVIDRNDVIWAATIAGLYKCDLRSHLVTPVVFPPEYLGKPVSMSIIGLTIDQKGFIWCSSFSGLIYNVNSATGEVKVIDEFVKKEGAVNYCNAICTDSKNRIWFGPRMTGLAMFSETADSFQYFVHNPLISSTINSATIGALFMDGQGILWIGTHGQGASYFNPDRQFFTSFYYGSTDKEGLGSGLVRAISQDLDGNFWIGTSNGLNKYDPSTKSFSLYRKEEARPITLSDNSVRAVYTDRKNRIWVGTSFGLNMIDEDRKSATQFIRDRNDPDKMMSTSIYSMREDRNGILWLAGSGGLEWYDEKNNRFINRKTDSLLKRIPTVSFTMCVYHDSKGNTWCGQSRDGLYKINYEKKEFVHYTATGEVNDLPHNQVTDIREDKKGYIWIGTGGGLSRFDPASNHFHTYTADSGLLVNRVAGLLFDSKNRVWFSSSRGIGVFDQEKNTFRFYTVEDGLPTNQFNDQSAYATADGRFCYPGLNGFVIFHPDSITQNPFIPPVQITGVSVLGEPKRLNTHENLRELMLSWKENFFTIEFSGLNYEQSSKNEYACQLIGFDKEVLQLGKTNRVSYTNVPPGHYTLHIMASNNDGVWNKAGLEIPVIIIPPFWNTAWFRITLIVALSLIIYAIYRFRIYQIRKRESAKTEINKQIAELRLSALRTQMNPHFIFNSISSIQNLISLEKKDDSLEYIGKFSRLIRLILHQAENNSIVLSDEVDLLRLYLEMESLRFEKSFSYHVEVDRKLQDRDPEIPTMIIQPIVENAVVHGLLNKNKKGNLSVQFTLKEEFVECSVEDDGVGRRAAEEIKKGKLFRHNAIATRVTGERLQILNKVFEMPTSIQTIDLTDQEGNPRGTRVIIDLPIIEN